MGKAKSTEAVAPAQSTMSCGHCMSAPMSREHELAHLRCPGTQCHCSTLDHQPDASVREAQGKFCKVTTVFAQQHDPGVSADVLKLADRYTDMGTLARITGVIEWRAATAEYNKTKPSPADLRTLLTGMYGVDAAKVKGLDAKGLLALAIERRAYAAARAVMKKREEKSDQIKQIQTTAATKRQEQGEARMATATKSRTAKTAAKKAVPEHLSAFGGFKKGQTLTATRAFERETPLGKIKVKPGDRLHIDSIESRGENSARIHVGRMVFVTSLLTRLTEALGEARVAPKKASTKKPPVKKAAAKKATKKAPAKKAVAKKTTKRR